MTYLLPAFTGRPEKNKVYNCSAEHLLAALPDGSIDLALVSPPYDSLRKYSGNWSFDFEPIARESYRVLKSGGVLVWVVGDQTRDGSETFTSFRQALYFRDTVGFNAHDTMIYQKDMQYPDTNRYNQCFEYMFVFSKGKPKTVHLLTKPNRYAGVKITKTQREKDGSMRDGIGKREGRVYKDEGTLPNVWYFSSGYMKTTADEIAYIHPAMFPEALAERHILTWSNPGDLVLDYFAGSGTTLKMARNTGRDFIGCDISHEYVQICKERLRKPYDPHYLTRESPPLDDLPLFKAVNS